MTEQDIQTLENEFPALSGKAFVKAREEVLRSGQSILESIDGFIYRVFPDGRKEMVKKIEPPAHTTAGKIYKIQ